MSGCDASILEATTKAENLRSSLDIDFNLQIQLNDQVWIRSVVEGWEPAIVKSLKKDVMIVETLEGEPYTVEVCDIMKKSDLPADDQVDDLTSLSILNEASVLNAVRGRYTSGEIYTYSGLVLVALNPYCSRPFYGREVVWAHRGKKRDQLAPHLFAVAEEAFQGLLAGEMSQSIIINGESGAGKTMSTRLIMRYFSEAIDEVTERNDSSGKFLF